MPESSAIRDLGAFVAATTLDDIPPEVRHQARRTLLNFVAGALGAASDPTVAAAARVLGECTGRATVIGRGDRLEPMAASFVNAIASNLLDYDDTHLATVIHPGAPVAPPALALAETRALGGADLVLATALGVEVACRIGLSVSPEHYDRGWHITATCGVFGSAAASARLLGLDAEGVAHAIGIAASASSGLVENLASAAKNVGVGNAARNGLLAARLAAEGYAAAPTALEGRLGWARASGRPMDLEVLTGELGSRWELARNTYKPYPCGIVMHSVVDAGLALRAGLRDPLREVVDVEVAGDALLLARGDRAVTDERDARVSIHHCAAAALLWGAAGVREFGRERVMDEAVRTMRSRVRVALDASQPRGAARMTVRLAGGEVLETTVVHPKGSEAVPLSDAELEAKLRELAAYGGARCEPDAVIEAVWGLERAPSVAPLTALVAGR